MRRFIGEAISRRENPMKSAIFWLPFGRQDFALSASFLFVSDVYDIASSEESLHLKQNLVAQLMIICILCPWVFFPNFGCKIINVCRITLWVVLQTFLIFRFKIWKKSQESPDALLGIRGSTKKSGHFVIQGK